MADVYVSAVINAPASAVWAVIRDFNALPEWHPMIARSEIEETRASDQIGCIRAFQLHDGAAIREQLLSLSDPDRSFSYSILASEMGVENYVASVKLTPITELDRCFAEWSASFDCAPEAKDELVQMIAQDVFAGGFRALDAQFALSPRP